MERSIYFSLIILLTLLYSLTAPVFAQNSSEVSEISTTTSKVLAESYLIKRVQSIEDLIRTLEEMGHISTYEADNFFTQLNTIDVKLKSTKESGGAIGEYMDLAEDFDSLAHRIAIYASVSNVDANLFEIDEFTGKKNYVADTNGETIEIISATPAKLRLMLQTRQNILQEHFKTQGHDDIDWKYEKELNRLKNIESALAKPDLNRPVMLETSIPVAIQHDLLGPRILGIVRSYRFRPIVGLCELTPKIETRSIVGELDPQIRSLKEKLKKEFLADSVSENEYLEFQKGISAIEKLEREYKSDGRISDEEWTTLYSALRNLDRRVASTATVHFQ